MSFLALKTKRENEVTYMIQIPPVKRKQLFTGFKAKISLFSGSSLKD